MDDKKRETILQLVGDKEMLWLLEKIVYNWKVAVDRILQIKKEREENLCDAGDVEALGVFCRMEEVYGQMYQLLDSPQAVLLRSVAKRLRPLAEDKRMDGEIVQMTMPRELDPAIEPVTFWDRIMETKVEGQNDSETATIMTDLYVKNILPHLANEDALKIMQILVSQDKSEEQREQVEEASNELLSLGKKLRIVGRGSRQLVGMGLMAAHIWMKALYEQIDMDGMEPSEVGCKFEEAKKELLESDAWKDYWTEHRKHLGLQGDLEAGLKADAEEVEQWLIHIHGYLYNKWHDGPETFGEALQEKQLTDEQMMMLLFYLAKKDALARGDETTAERRAKMEENVVEVANRLKELVVDDYYLNYEQLWQQLVRGEALSQLLMEYNSSKYNNGFSMQCLCKIVGYLHREYHLFGDRTPEDLGKALGDKYSRETFSNYIKKKKSDLNELCFKEIAEALEVTGKVKT